MRSSSVVTVTRSSARGSSAMVCGATGMGGTFMASLLLGPRPELDLERAREPAPDESGDALPPAHDLRLAGHLRPEQEVVVVDERGDEHVARGLARATRRARGR